MITVVLVLYHSLMVAHTYYTQYINIQPSFLQIPYCKSQLFCPHFAQCKKTTTNYNCLNKPICKANDLTFFVYIGLLYIFTLYHHIGNHEHNTPINDTKQQQPMRNVHVSVPSAASTAVCYVLHTVSLIVKHQFQIHIYLSSLHTVAIRQIHENAKT